MFVTGEKSYTCDAHSVSIRNPLLRSHIQAAPHIFQSHAPHFLQIHCRCALDCHFSAFLQNQHQSPASLGLRGQFRVARTPYACVGPASCAPFPEWPFISPVLHSAFFLIRAYNQNGKRACGSGFWPWPRRRVASIPRRAVSNEPTPATGKRRAARRVLAQRPSGFVAPRSQIHQGICSLVAPRHPAFCAKTDPLFILI